MKGGHGLLLATIAISMFLDGLDGTVVNVALPSIAESYGIGTGDTSWVITVYYLVMAGLILVFGRICDKGAIKKVLIAGMAFFTVGSLFCGISPSLPVLLASRAFQGVGAAMLAASAVMLGVKFLPKEKLGLGMTLVVMGTAIGVALGPSVGAALTEMISWHWIFFINVPIGAVAIVLAHKAIPADRGVEKGDLDVVGSVLLFVAIVLGLFVIERIPSAGINVTSGVALVGCILFFVAFTMYEKGRASPVFDMTLFRNRDFDKATMAYVLVNLTIMGMVYLFPFLLKKTFGLDTLGSGLILSLQAVSMIVCCVLVGKSTGRVPNRAFAVVSCSIMLLFMVLASTFSTDTPLTFLAMSLLICGCIWGIGGGPMGARMVDSLPDEQRGSGSSMVSFVMYFSSALGTALFAGLFGFGSGEGSASISDVSVETFMDGFGFCALVAIVLALASVYFAWSLKGEGVRE